MKCIKQADKYMRVPEKMAVEKVKAGWLYCPKSEFKKATNKQVVAKPQDEVRQSKGRKKAKKVKVEATDPVDKMIEK